MSHPIKHARRRRTGLSLLEILVVLAIFAMATAVIMPSSARMLDQATAHAVFFEFQRDVSELRREANRTQSPLRLIDPQVQPDPKLGDRRLRLREPWRYTMAPGLDIDEGGACGVTTANLLNGDRIVMTLRTDDGTCRFSRLQTTAAQPPEPSSLR